MSGVGQRGLKRGDAEERRKTNRKPERDETEKQASGSPLRVLGEAEDHLKISPAILVLLRSSALKTCSTKGSGNAPTP
jgi:hypothetical protein